MKFDKKIASDYINKLLKKHKIGVYGWSSTSCGRAKIKQRMIKIPQPTNIDRFAVCLHEIFHIIGRKGSKSFEKEFYCDKYALDTLIELGYDTSEWIRRTKWHSLSRIAMAHNRGLNHNAINAEIREFFKDIDFNGWLGKKVFVGHAYYKTNDPSTIELTQAMSKNEVEMLLNRQGLRLDKSQRDDSTNGRYIVHSNGDGFGPDFGNLSEIISHYQLSL